LLSLFESVTWPILAPEVARQAAISQPGSYRCWRPHAQHVAVHAY
jgi:hypothetical protein